jgi:hypothetical protein
VVRQEKALAASESICCTSHIQRSAANYRQSVAYCRPSCCTTWKRVMQPSILLSTRMADSLIRGRCRIDVLAVVHQLQHTVDVYNAVHAVAESCSAALSCLGYPPNDSTAAGARVALGYRWPELPASCNMHASTGVHAIMARTVQHCTVQR